MDRLGQPPDKSSEAPQNGAMAQVPNVNGDCNVFGNNNHMNCSHVYAPQPRIINDSTAITIERAAREAGPHKFLVWLTGSDPDAGPYSMSLISGLNKGGWTGDIAGATIGSFPPPQDVGLHLCGKSTSPSEAATALLRIMVLSKQDVSHTYATCNHFGVNFEGLEWAKYDQQTVGIIIGRNGPSSP